VLCCLGQVKNRGIYNSWHECKEQIHGVKGAKYKSFENRGQAEEAFKKGVQKYIQASKVNEPRNKRRKKSNWGNGPKTGPILEQGYWPGWNWPGGGLRWLNSRVDTIGDYQERLRHYSRKATRKNGTYSF